MTYPTTLTIFDFETNGLHPRLHKPIEAAWLVIEDGRPVKHAWYFLHWPDLDIPPEVTAIHGITKEMIAEDPAVPSLVLAELYEDIIDSGACATHNGTNFDLCFLEACMATSPLQKIRDAHVDTAALFKANGLKMERAENETLDQFNRRVLDTRSTFKFNLRLACESNQIPVTNTHRAMDDVLLTWELYKKLCLSL